MRNLLPHEVLDRWLDLCDVTLAVNTLAHNDPHLLHSIPLTICNSSLRALNRFLDIESVQVYRAGR